MGARLRSRWQQIKRHSVRMVLMALLVVVIVLIVLSILGYIFNWGWTGLGPYISPPHPKDSDFQREKTLWDWLQLLIIPVVLAVAGYVINLTISRGEQAATEQRAQSEREAAEKRAETEREIALDNQCETALKEYIDKMSELLLHEGLLESDPKKEVQQIARIQTLTVLNRLDGKRKGSVLQFLNESGLIKQDKTIIRLYRANLRGADLSEAFLSGAHLYRVDLSGANLRKAHLGYIPENKQIDQGYIEGANLSRANLSEANLSEADLEEVELRYGNLIGANLNAADLERAKLNHANLTGANLSYAKLTNADLKYANLAGVDLTNADLNFYSDQGNGEGVDLSGANLTGVIGITVEQLEKQAKSLKGATMPDGSKYP